MKRQCLFALTILIAVSIFTPSPATVYINFTDLGSGLAQIGYDATSETELIRAFALDITVSNGIILSAENLSADFFVVSEPIVLDEGEIISGSVLALSSVPGTFPGVG